MELLLLEAEQADSTQPVTPNQPVILGLLRFKKSYYYYNKIYLQQGTLRNPVKHSFRIEPSQNDSYLLNEEFKSAMGRFGRIKEQVAILEEENGDCKILFHLQLQVIQIMKKHLCKTELTNCLRKMQILEFKLVKGIVASLD